MLSARKIFITLLLCIAALVVMQAVVVVDRLNHDTSVNWTLYQLFNFDEESSVPVWFSAIALVACAALLAAIARHAFKRQDKGARYWALLGFIFLFLSFDEAAAIHEQLIPLGRRLVPTGGAFYFAWIIPYGIALAVLLVVLVPFLKSLPRQTMWLFLFAGALYVGGAIGLEMVGGAVISAAGIGGSLPAYHLVATAEETLEMLGIATFIYALIRYMAEQNIVVNLRFGR